MSMANNKTSGSGYAIRFNVSSIKDSSDEDDDLNKEEDEDEEGSTNSFIDPLQASLLNKSNSLSRKMRKKKVNVVKLENELSDDQSKKKDVLPTDSKISEVEQTKEKSIMSKESLIKPLSALRKKHSSTLIAQPQSAPSSELNSPTTLSKRHHIPSSSSINANSSCKDMSTLDAEKDSKASITSSDASLNSNTNNCNNKDDVFSIFSGLKDKLGRFSAESREILDRKVFKTTSVDMPKIASVLAGNPIDGELLAEEAKEDGQFEVCSSSKSSDEKSLESARQSSVESSASLEPVETEMREMSSKGTSEGETNNFDIGRLMKLVQSDSSKKLTSRGSYDEGRREKEFPEEFESIKTDDSFTSLDIPMTPSDILTHEAAVDAFRSSVTSLLDPGTKRLSDTSGHAKLVKKSSVTGSQKNVNPFASEKKETISKSSSISMTLSSLLSRQKSTSKISSGTSPENIVMISKAAEIKPGLPVEQEDVSGINQSETDSCDVVSRDVPLDEEYVMLQSSDWPCRKYFETIKRRISSKFFSVVVIFLAWLCVPLPPYMAGMCAGIIGTLLAVQMLNIFHMWFPATAKKDDSHEDQESTGSLDAEFGFDIRESKNIDGSFKGWLNELGSAGGKTSYDLKDYHINNTHTIYVTLEGTNLRLQTPRLSMPKRALWSDESPTSVTFVKQRHYDLLGSKVSLLPDNLVSKRLWSKKYPIYVEITKSHSIPTTSLRSRHNASKLLSARTNDNQVEDSSIDPPKTSQAADSAASSSSSTGEAKKVLYLFARTSREKEDWFRRFRAASQGHPWPTRFSDIVKNMSGSQAFKRKTHRRTASQPNKKSITTDNESPPSNITDNTGSDITDPSNQTSMIDYSSLTPELNLQYYAQYMSKSMATKTNPATSDVTESSKSSSGQSEKPNKRSSSVGGSSPVEKRGKESSKTDGHVKNEKKDEERTEEDVDAKSEADDCDVRLMWLNTLVSRCFMDFLREKYWVEKIREKIQKKLSKIHVPFIMDQLSVTGIDLGSSVPTICGASPPYLDDRGFWVDLKVSYSGGFCITMETKCNLMKLKQNSGKPSDAGSNGSDVSSQTSLQAIEKRLAALYSDEEDSAESSTDEESRLFEEDIDEVGEDKKNQPIGKRLLRLVDKISQSKYFQQATDYKYIRRAIEEVSNTRLELNVEVKSLSGTLAVNVPPPPTDRIWYGFRGNPQFDLVARPKVGVREVSLSPVTEWIEKKLAIEFQRVFVMPNMDDVKIPLMLDHLKL